MDKTDRSCFERLNRGAFIVAVSSVQIWRGGLSICLATCLDQAMGISWHLGVDGISLFLIVLTGILFPLVIVGIDPHHNETSYFAWMLLLQAGVMGSFLSLDLFLFFVMFEIVLVPMYFLIGGWGYDQRVYAATKFFYTQWPARRSCSSE